MLIDQQALTHWMSTFYGYGSWKAPIWFVAYEEGGGDLPEEVADKVDYFKQITSSANLEPTLCDVREVYKHIRVWFEGRKEAVYTSQYDYRFGRDAIIHGVWKNLTGFAHGYRKETIPDLLAYQKDLFASPAVQRETLIKLYPLPSPHSHSWYYSWLDMPHLPFLKSRALYENHIYDNRIGTILQAIKIHKPEVVLMYGMNNINALKDSVQTAFPGTKFKMIKAVKLQTPQHHLTRLDDNTTLLITTQIPALRHNRAETGFNWEALGRSLQQ